MVTGGAGFLGRHIVEELVVRGVRREDISVPRSDTDDLRLIENCERAVKGVDAVIHTAGITGNTEFHKNHPAQIFYDNMVMGVELMEAARKAGVNKFVTIGSATEYPDNAPLPFREESLWSGSFESIHAPYTIAKKMLLVMAQAYRKQYGFNAVHLLLTNMYGPGDKLDGMVIPMLIKKVYDAKQKGEKSIEVWGTGRPTRDFIFVKDAAAGVVSVLEKYDGAEPVNIGSGWEISIRELAELIVRIMDFKGELRFDTSRPDGQPRRMLDTSRAEREFGFRALTDFETGLRATIKSFGFEL